MSVLVLAGCGSDNAAPAANQSPIANAGPDLAVLTGSTVTLDGSGSSDADGDALTYTWIFESIPGASTAVLTSADTAAPTFTADVDGTYTVSLIVNDGKVDSTKDTVIVTATANSAPIADAGSDQSVQTGSIVTLDGSGSLDANGDPLTYTWTFDSVPASSTAVLSSANTSAPSFTADLNGTYTVSLVVNDGKIDSAKDTVTVTATAAPNTAPVANAGPDQNVLNGALVTLDGTGSSDADGNPLTYQWILESRPASSTATLAMDTTTNPTFTADLDGIYIASLVVNDGSVNSTKDFVIIGVNTAINDDHGNDVATATAITSEVAVTGKIETFGDLDYFSFTIGAASTISATYKATEISPGNIKSIDLSIHDTVGTEFYRDVALASETALLTLEAGTYYVRVVALSSSDLAAYEFTIDTNEGIVITDDHGNDIASATPITSGNAVTGQVETNGDIDYFSLVVSVQSTITATYKATANINGQVKEIEFTLYDSSETKLLRELATTEETTLITLDPGTYYIKLKSTSASDLSAYEFTVTDPGSVVSDDYPDDTLSAALLTSGVPVSGQIETVGDQDYFTFNLASPGKPTLTYKATANAFGNTRDIRIQLFDSNGSLIYWDSATSETVYAFASNLAAGDYYVRLTSLFSSDLSGYQFTVDY